MSPFLPRTLKQTGPAGFPTGPEANQHSPLARLARMGARSTHARTACHVVTGKSGLTLSTVFYTLLLECRRRIHFGYSYTGTTAHTYLGY